MSGEQSDRDGMRQVFEGQQGYYVESSPGAGPGHHDDLPASVGAHESKRTPGADAHRSAYLVLDRSGQIVGTYLPTVEGWEWALRRAEQTGGLVCSLPVLVDRTGG